MFQPSRRDILRITGSAALVFAIAKLAKAEEWHQRRPRFEDRRLDTRAEPSSDPLLDEITEELLIEFPDTATMLGVDTGPRAALKSRLADVSPEGVAAQAKACAERLQRLKGADVTGLQGLAAVNRAVALESHEIDNAGYAFLNVFSGEPYVVSQMTGSFSWIPMFLDTQHRIETAADADAYLARLEAYAGQLDGETERIRADAAAGVIPPDFILVKTLKQMDGVRAKPIAEWGLVTSLSRRAAEKGLGGDYGDAARKMVETTVAPALDRQIAALESLKPMATADAGVWKLPQGETFYAWALRRGTTTNLDSDQVHEIGLEQVAELSSQMDELLRGQGLTQGTVSERVAILAKDPRHLFANNDAGRAELIAYLNGLLDAFRPKMPELFRTLNEAPVEIKRVPPDIEAGSPLGMMVDGSVDGTRPAIYYINLQDTGIWPKFQLPTLTYHEALPGHVWQFTFSHKLPLIRTILGFNAYIEGYALYSEQLADELGVYGDDPLGRLGYLSAIQLRACRLVVDTGLHAKRWSREQAIAWLQERTGDDLMATTSEIDRYIVRPGQATGYKVGHNEINRLRNKAKLALGARYDLRDFNDALLLSGSVPLTLLERIVDDYVAASQKRPT
jgi:uncharacterized protein (DUF885 family)